MQKLLATLINEALLFKMAVSPGQMAIAGMGQQALPQKIFIPASTRAMLKNMAILLGLITLMIVFNEAFAGTDGDDFADIYTKLEGWSKGTLGKVIALGMFLVGLATGVVQQNIMAVVIGISGALSLYYGPGIISSVVSATI
jgi:conjugal transfer pilus assembly protein TraA